MSGIVSGARCSVLPTTAALLIGATAATIVTAVLNRQIAAPPLGAGPPVAATGTATRADEAASLRQRLERTRAQNRALAAGLRRAQAAGPRRDAREVPDAGGDGGAPEARATPTDPCAVAAGLSAQAERCLAARDGPAVLTAFRDLTVLGEAGYPAAIDLALRIAEGNGKAAGVPWDAFLRVLTSERSLPLLKYALGHPGTNAEFRSLAVRSLAVCEDPEVVPLLAARLLEEDDEEVRNCLAQVLAQRDPETAATALADSRLGRADQSEARREIARRLVVNALFGGEDARSGRALREAAVSDPDPQVRTIAQVIALVNDPPATGWLVADPRHELELEAAGLRLGDIVLAGDEGAAGVQQLLETLSGAMGPDRDLRLTVLRAGTPIEVALPAGHGDLARACKGVVARR